MDIGIPINTVDFVGSVKNYNSTKCKNLVELAKECPGLQVTITLGELIEANRLLIAEVKRELEQEIADSKAETYISR